MPEVYQKRGAVVRWESGTVVSIREAGEAVEDGDVFRCAPLRDVPLLPERDASEVIDAARRVETLIGAPLRVERLIVSDGYAEHTFGGQEWSDVSRRVHLAVTHRSWRLLVDAGSFDIDGLEPLLAALSRLREERTAPPRLRFAPRVTAALISSLTAVAPPNVRLQQMEGGRDGKGAAVVPASGPPWPNWYRPSYRSRPTRLPMNLAAHCSVTSVEESLPRAIGILAPPSGLTMRLLCVDREEVFATTARIVRIDAIAEPSEWYPFGAGVWGAEAEVAT